MPSIGDVIVRFLADTSQLSGVFESVEARQARLSQSAAASTVELKASQAELKASLAAVRVEGGATTENMERLAMAEKRTALAAVEAKEAHEAMRVQLGIAAKEGGFMAEGM